MGDIAAEVIPTARNRAVTVVMSAHRFTAPTVAVNVWAATLSVAADGEP